MRCAGGGFGGIAQRRGGDEDAVRRGQHRAGERLQRIEPVAPDAAIQFPPLGSDEREPVDMVGLWLAHDAGEEALPGPQQIKAELLRVVVVVVSLCRVRRNRCKTQKLWFLDWIQPSLIPWPSGINRCTHCAQRYP